MEAGAQSHGGAKEPERELDLIQNPFLTGVGGVEDKSLKDDPRSVAVKTKTLAEKQELVRGRLAQWLTAGAIILIFLFAISVAADWMRPEEVKTLSAVILTPLVGLAGSAAGFYFGQRS
jgi:hypothetical protein